ncbi:MAG: DUF374 domain-containing protein [Candidatus Eisenbacteria bacterium]|nr:DUF374 domain-containing protein [Candidatus Eisenbacteria bacterium]
MSAGARHWGARDAALIGAASAVGPALLRTLGATWRLDVVGEERVNEVRRRGGVVHAFWHGHLAALEYAYRGRGIVVLSSLHRDGEISARLMTSLGYRVVRGSSSRGSTRGLLKMLAAAGAGEAVAITPDGPRGPAGSVQKGIFLISDRAGVPIVPVGVAACPAARLDSWDRMLVPLPFARVAVVHGEPIPPSPDVDPEARAGALRRSIDAATAEAARRAGPEARGPRESD